MLQKKILVALCLTLLPLLNFSHGLAQTTVAHDACDAATVTAARSVGVPERFLLAIARAESGRTIKQRFAPWPWAVNVEGRGIFFQTRAGASRFIRDQLKAGATSIDVGCFQVNLKWHGNKFDSLDQVLDPYSNADYAARFLKTLHQEFGNWEQAAGAYHSRTERLSRLYLARLEPILAKLQRPGSTIPVSGNTQVTNNFPLLTGSANSVVGGSLFPETTITGRSLFKGEEGKS